MNLNIPLVWVELSRKPSKYLINSINIHNQKFPEIKKYLIINREFENTVKNLKAQIISIEDLESYEEILSFQSADKAWNGLQKSYWTNTTARFYAINVFMKELKIQKLIHLESDCVLLSLNSITEMFKSNDWGLKYAKQHQSYGCASILLVNLREELQNFLDFTNRNWHRDNYTDMNALGEFVAYSENSDFLYSGNPFIESKKEIFDGVTIGKFFIGSDARNSRWPFSARGVVGNFPEEFNPRDYRILVSNNQVILKGKTSILELQNIHIHSKRIPNNWEKLSKIINRDGSQTRNIFWRLGHFDSIVFKERFMSFIQRRFLGIKTADPRFR
jgi:hypothetical protein